MLNCFEGYLTIECAKCEFWRDGSIPSEGIGCAAPFPIDHCDAFAKESRRDQENHTAQPLTFTRV